MCGAATVADAPDLDAVDSSHRTWDRPFRFFGAAGGGVSDDPAVNYTIAVSL